MTGATGASEHGEREDNPWDIDLKDHPARSDSPTFVHAKGTFHKIMATLAGAEPYGPGPWQAHHGGSIWVMDAGTWRLFRNTLGIEWSLQFLARVDAVETLRQQALALVARFPDTAKALADLGDTQSMAILVRPIVDAAGIGVYVDSLWNSCVPLAAAVHVGVLGPKNPTGGGWHHYPEPIVAGEFIKQPDYTYWVVDPVAGTPVAVSPTAPKGSGFSTVKVEYAQPGTDLHESHMAAHDAGHALLLGGDHPLAVQAFARQQEEKP